ncbi:MAG: tetratricopeptide repeat protein [Desulfobacteraceae bacterium]|nr:tetratricopeptide repeat protein [Desulfobacteraceae bacterium]
MNFFTKSANQGNHRAQVNIGLMYAKGLGVNKDIDKAKVWFKKAASQGNKTAKTILKEKFNE